MNRLTYNAKPYTLLPFLADWSSGKPSLIYIYQTEIERSLRGYETRAGHREYPRARYTKTVYIEGEREAEDFYARMQSGTRVDHSIAHLPGANEHVSRFAVPYCGRGTWTAPSLGLPVLDLGQPNVVLIEPTAWQWQVNDYAFLASDAGAWAVCRVTSVQPDSLGLSAALETSGASSEFAPDAIMPILFGVMEPVSRDLRTPLHGSVEIALNIDTYRMSSGLPLACAGDPDWPFPPPATQPVADFTLNVIDLYVSFNASVSTQGTSPVDGITQVPIISYEWDFGDGTNNFGVTTSRTYVTGGTYSVVLRIRDQVGRISTRLLQVTVTDPNPDPSL
jgi:hypothetical protein